MHINQRQPPSPKSIWSLVLNYKWWIRGICSIAFRQLTSVSPYVALLRTIDNKLKWFQLLFDCTIPVIHKRWNGDSDDSASVFQPGKKNDVAFHTINGSTICPSQHTRSSSERVITQWLIQITLFVTWLSSYLLCYAGVCVCVLRPLSCTY